jgi:predicted transcriptional regulator
MRYPIGERKVIHKYRRDRLQPNDYKIIAALKFRNADREYMPIKQVVIAKMTGLQQSKVSKALDRLTARGIVSRFRYGYKEDAIKLLVYNPLWFPNGINVIELPFYG